jgi:uncharacterized protein
MKKLLLYSFIIFMATACGFNISNSKMKKKLKNAPFTQIHEVRMDQDHQVRVLFTPCGGVKTGTLVFVHGTPGGSTSFLAYHEDSTLQKNFDIISYDRPGYGYQDGYKSLNSIAAQAQVLNTVIRQFKAEKVCLIAHSFGGAIAIQAALQKNTQIEKILLLAVAVDPANEKYFWIGKFSKWKATKWMLPKMWQVAGDEKYSHEEELRKLLPQLEKYNTPTWAVHGTKDMVVPYKNLAFLESNVKKEYLKCVALEGENHFIPFTRFDLVKTYLLDWHKE